MGLTESPTSIEQFEGFLGVKPWAGGGDWLTLVRRRLAADHAQDVPTAASLARGLGMSTRSLRRRFAEHDTSFTAVRREVATELANACLRRGLSASETGFALGYAEPSAFFRAYKGWTGEYVAARA